MDLPFARQWPNLPLRCGAMAYRVDGERGLSLLLIRRRAREIWWPPKGRPSPGLALHETAATEAYEEAGVEGRIASLPIGSFLYTKCVGPSECRRVEVLAFPLEVTRVHGRWPEAEFRERRWFTLNDAVRSTKSIQLAGLMGRLERQLAGGVVG